MRISYKGLDKRDRVAEVSRIKFLFDGFKGTDKKGEWDESLSGPIIVMHTLRHKGGKRLTFSVSESFNMQDAKNFLLKNGWLDLEACTLKMENLY